MGELRQEIGRCVMPVTTVSRFGAPQTGGQGTAPKFGINPMHRNEWSSEA